MQSPRAAGATIEKLRGCYFYLVASETARSRFLFSPQQATLSEMKVCLLAAFALAGGRLVQAQEIELPPIVVTGTFELRQGPSVTDLFTLHLEKQIETKQAVEDAMARAPWYYSRYWNYFPMRIESSSGNLDEFLRPQYLTLDNQKQDWELRKSEKQSLFD